MWWEENRKKKEVQNKLVCITYTCARDMLLLVWFYKRVITESKGGRNNIEMAEVAADKILKTLGIDKPMVRNVFGRKSLVGNGEKRQ